MHWAIPRNRYQLSTVPSSVSRPKEDMFESTNSECPMSWVLTVARSLTRHHTFGTSLRCLLSTSTAGASISAFGHSDHHQRLGGAPNGTGRCTNVQRGITGDHTHLSVHLTLSLDFDFPLQSDTYLTAIAPLSLCTVNHRPQSRPIFGTRSRGITLASVSPAASGPLMHNQQPTYPSPGDHPSD